jgi:hypothetical protein
VFNSVAVPDPEQFNSRSFDRDAFIKEARQTNEKLVAELNGNVRANCSSIDSSMSSSSLHTMSPTNSQLHSSSSTSSSSTSSSPNVFQQSESSSSVSHQIASAFSSTPKSVTNFSISSLIGGDGACEKGSAKQHSPSLQSNLMLKYIQSLNAFSTTTPVNSSNNNTYAATAAGQFYQNYLNHLSSQISRQRYFNFLSSSSYINQQPK